MKKQKAERQDYSNLSLIKSKMENSIIDGKQASQLCIEELRKRGCDFSLLFWLRNQESLPGTEIGRELITFLQDVSVPVNRFTHSDFRDAFFSHLRAEFNANGLRKVAPENFVVACGEGGKARAIQEASRAKWPRPNQTFCFQTRGMNSAFFIYQCWQDGIRKILELFEKRQYEDPTGGRVKVEQIYEHSWGDTRLSRLLIDWEIESPWVSDRRTPEQLRATAEKFPMWFVQKLVMNNALDPNATVHCTVKDKSRDIERGTKVSFHFSFNITGCPKGSHSVACSRVLEPLLPKLKLIAKAKSLEKLSDQDIDMPWIGIDWRTVSGSHGFSVPFSRKKPADPYPSVPYKLAIHRGKGDTWVADRQYFSWRDAEHSFAALGEDKCLKIFYHASYTPPAADCVSYQRICSVPFVAEVRCLFIAAPRNRTPAPCQRAYSILTEPHQGQQGAVTRHKAVHHPVAPDFLPAWLVSDLNSRGGAQLNTRMPCLQVPYCYIVCVYVITDFNICYYRRGLTYTTLYTTSLTGVKRHRMSRT
jgi:hypothetical protein